MTISEAEQWIRDNKTRLLAEALAKHQAEFIDPHRITVECYALVDGTLIRIC